MHAPLCVRGADQLPGRPAAAVDSLRDMSHCECIPYAATAGIAFILLLLIHYIDTLRRAKWKPLRCEHFVENSWKSSLH